MLAALQAEEAQLRQQYEERLRDLAANIDAVQKTLALCSAGPREMVVLGPQTVAPPKTRRPRRALRMADIVDASKWTPILHGKTQMEAVRVIAEADPNGEVRTAEIKQILIATGMATGKPRNVNSHVWSMIAADPDFEKVAAGVFRLRRTAPAATQAELPSGDASRFEETRQEVGLR